MRPRHDGPRLDWQVRHGVFVADEARHDAAAVQKHSPAAAESSDDRNEGRVAAGEQCFNVEKLLRLPATVSRQARWKGNKQREIEFDGNYVQRSLLAATDARSQAANEEKMSNMFEP